MARANSKQSSDLKLVVAAFWPPVLSYQCPRDRECDGRSSRTARLIDTIASSIPRVPSAGDPTIPQPSAASPAAWRMSKPLDNGSVRNSYIATVAARPGKFLACIVSVETALVDRRSTRSASASQG
jgi:hypothetical protein